MWLLQAMYQQFKADMQAPTDVRWALFAYWLLLVLSVALIVLEGVKFCHRMF